MILNAGTPAFRVETRTSVFWYIAKNHFFQMESLHTRYIRYFFNLLALDGSVNMANKEQSSSETNHPKHQEETVADASHVSEEERCLHKSCHV